MKKHFKIVGAMLALLSFSACNKEKGIDYSQGFGESPIDFHANIAVSQTRASDVNWENNDAIGVFMVRSGSVINTTNELPANNKKYVTKDGKGLFTAATESDVVTFPADGGNVDISAYYPFTTNLSGNLVNVNVVKQENPAAIDLLFADNLKGVSAVTAKENIKLSFKHRLSKIVFNFKADGETPITGISAVLKGFNTLAHFNLSDAKLTPTKSVADIQANVSGECVSAILIPGKPENAEVKVQAGGKSYSYKLPAGTELKAGTKLVFTATLHPDGTITMLEPNGTITDWEIEEGGSVDLVPDGEDATLILSAETYAFNAAGGSTDITVTSNTDWTVAKTDAAWLTVDPANGRNDGAFKLIAAANTAGERMVTLTVTAGSITKTIAVSQAAGTNPSPGTEQSIFRETYGWAGGNKAAKPYPQIATYTHWDNAGFKFEATEKMDIRAAGNLANAIWFAAKKGQVFKVSGFNAAGYKNLKLKYDITANLYSVGSSADLKLMSVKCGDKTFIGPDITITKEDGYNDKFYTVTVEGLPENATSLEFMTDATNTVGIRLGAIELIGTK